MGAPSATRPHVSFRVVRADGGPEISVPMTGETLTCGTRGDLTLPDDPFIAPVQARFFFSGERLAIEDLGGGNGVFSRLKVERELPVGGELRLGRQRLLLEAILKRWALRAYHAALRPCPRSGSVAFRS